MKDTQAWGWLAAGVLALGLNGFYHDGGAQWAHRVLSSAAYRSEAVVALASGRVEHFLCDVGLVAQSKTRPYRVDAAIARLQGEAARGQAGFAPVEAMSMRQEAALARLEANRARIEAQMARVRDLPAIVGPVNVASCPRLRVMVPRVQIPEIKIPEIQVPKISVPEIRVEVPASPAPPVVSNGDPI